MTKSLSCLTCDLIAHRDRGEAPLWDSILRAASWDLVHSYNTALPGWLVLVARRHVEAIDELTDEEAAELGVLLRQTWAALRHTTGCVKTYVCQFASRPSAPTSTSTSSRAWPASPTSGAGRGYSPIWACRRRSASARRR